MGALDQMFLDPWMLQSQQTPAMSGWSADAMLGRTPPEEPSYWAKVAQALSGDFGSPPPSKAPPPWPAPPNPGPPPLTGAPPIPNLGLSTPQAIPTIGAQPDAPPPAAAAPAAPSPAPAPSWLKSAAQPRFESETPHPGAGGPPKVETIGPGPGANLPRSLQEPQGNQLLGGFGDWLAANRNTLMMLGAGIAGGKNLGDSVSQGLMGAAQGKTADDALVNKREMYKQLVSSGLTPQQALMAVTNPEAMKAMLPMMFPKYDQLKNENYLGGFDPATGKSTVQGALPQLKEVKPGTSLSAITPPVPAYGLGGTQTPGQPLPTIPGSKEDIVTGGPDPEQTANMRKEIDKLPEVTTYQAAIPKYRSMIKSAQLDTAASDLEFLYGIAAVFDPNSVVREGEMKLVGAAQSLPEDVVGYMRQRVYGGARLTPSAKQRLLEVATNRMEELKQNVDTRLSTYPGIANRFGMRSEDVMPNLQTMPGSTAPGGWRLLGVR